MDGAARGFTLPPGPGESPFTQLTRFGKQPYGYLRECAREFGSIFTVRLPKKPPHVLVSDADDIGKVFSLAADAYETHYNLIPLNVGESAIHMLDGEPHRRKRQVVMPLLHGERLDAYVARLDQAAALVIDAWTPGSTIALKPALQEISLRAILACFFGQTDPATSARLRGLIARWITVTINPMTFVAGLFVGAARLRGFLDQATAEARKRPPGALARALPWKSRAAAKAALVDEILADLERCRREKPGERTDLVARFAEACDVDGAPYPLSDACDELISMIVAGHESASTTMTWALVHILRRPDVVTAIRGELREVFGDGPVDPRRVKELVYLDACIKETLRVTPIAPVVNRLLRRPLTLGGFDLPEGTLVWPCIYLAHHDPKIWGDPDEFRPARWLDGWSPPKHAYFPYGGGRRTCIGMSFVTLEMRIALAELFARRRLEILDVGPVEPVEPAFAELAITPKKEVRARVLDLA